MADLTGRTFDVLDDSTQKGIDAFNESFRLGLQLGQQDKHYRQNRKDRIKREKLDRDDRGLSRKDRLAREKRVDEDRENRYDLEDKRYQEGKDYRKDQNKESKRRYEEGKKERSDYRKTDDKRQEARDKVLKDNSDRDYELRSNRLKYDLAKSAGTEEMKKLQQQYAMKIHQLEGLQADQDFDAADFSRRQIVSVINQRNNLDAINSQERYAALKEGRDARFYVGIDHGTGNYIPYVEEGEVREFSQDEMKEFLTSDRDYVHNPVKDPNAPSKFHNMPTVELNARNVELYTTMGKISVTKEEDRVRFLKSTGMNPDDYKDNQIGPSRIDVPTFMQFKTKEGLDGMSKNQKQSLLRTIEAKGGPAFINEIISRGASEVQKQWATRLMQSVTQYQPGTLSAQRSETAKRNPDLGYQEYLESKYGPGMVPEE